MPEVCDCHSSEARAIAKRREFIVDIYSRFGPSEKATDEAFVDGVLQKYKGREGSLAYELFTKYGTADGFVEFIGSPTTFELEGPSFVSDSPGSKVEL